MPSAVIEPPAPLLAQSFTIEPRESLLYVIVRNDPTAMGSAMGHDHAVSATGWTGQVTWHPTDPSQCRVEFSVPVADLVVDAPSTVSRTGLGAETNATQRRKISENLRGKNQLWQAKHPVISFVATDCDGTSGEVRVRGIMNMRGQSVPVSLSMDVDTNDGFRATGAFDTTHTAFGFEPFRAAGGMLRNQDRLSFGIEVKG